MGGIQQLRIGGGEGGETAAGEVVALGSDVRVRGSDDLVAREQEHPII